MHLSEALKVNTSLTELTLDCNGLDHRAAKHLAGALDWNTSLTWLSMQDNCVGPEGVAHLAGALKGNRSLRGLNLAKNRLANNGKDLSGLTKLCKALPHTSLLSLDISYNSLPGDGVVGVLFAKTVIEHNTLRDFCKIDLDSLRARSPSVSKDSVRAYLDLVC